MHQSRRERQRSRPRFIVALPKQRLAGILACKPLSRPSSEPSFEDTGSSGGGTFSHFPFPMAI